MSDTKHLATVAHGIGFSFGLKLIEAQKKTEAGMPSDSDASRLIASECNLLYGQLEGFLYAASLILSEDDFQQFIYRGGFNRDQVQQHLNAAKARTIIPPL